MEKEIKLETVSPEMAEKWLNSNTGPQRTMRPGVAEKYAQDMRMGNWTECPDPVAFYKDGTLADGQHRLWAIVDSGISQKFYIVRDLSREAGLNIDTGLGRSLTDSMKVMDPSSNFFPELIAVCRAMDLGQRNANISVSNAVKLSVVERYEEAARWAVSHGPRGRGIRSSMLLAAVGRAYLHEKDHDRLIKFGAVMTSGFPDEGVRDTAAIAFRNFLQYTATSGTITSSAAIWRDVFLKAQNVIWYFMRGRELKQIKSVTEERYPSTYAKSIIGALNTSKISKMRKVYDKQLRARKGNQDKMSKVAC